MGGSYEELAKLEVSGSLSLEVEALFRGPACERHTPAHVRASSDTAGLLARAQQAAGGSGRWARGVGGDGLRALGLGRWATALGAGALSAGWVSVGQAGRVQVAVDRLVLGRTRRTSLSECRMHKGKTSGGLLARTQLCTAGWSE